MKSPAKSCRLKVPRPNLRRRIASTFNLQSSTFNCARAFTLVEVMVAVALMALIVIALMAVFSNTQRAFRASITQTDILENGRAAMDLMASDLGKMAASNLPTNNYANANFSVRNSGNPPLMQALVGSISGNPRTNILESFFILSSGNQNGVPTWYGTGYAVLTNNGTALYPLYRFSTNYPMASFGAVSNLYFRSFQSFLNAPTNYSHLIDGVVDLRIHAFDENGLLINRIGSSFITNSIGIPGEVGYIFLSNALPAAVEIEMATLEDPSLQRAESLPTGTVRDTYLNGRIGQVHVFRQRVSILNVDLAAYQ